MHIFAKLENGVKNKISDYFLESHNLGATLLHFTDEETKSTLPMPQT